MFSARFMSNFIIVLKPIIINKQKIIIFNIHSYKKQKNKFYVVKTTYIEINNVYNLFVI